MGVSAGASVGSTRASTSVVCELWCGDLACSRLVQAPYDPLCLICFLARPQMWYASVTYTPYKDGMPAWAAGLADA